MSTDRLFVTLAIGAVLVLAGPAPAANAELPSTSSVPAREGDARVYLTRAEALAILLPGAGAIAAESRRLSSDARTRVERRSGRRMASDTVTVWVGRKDGAVTGYAFILDEVGLHHPITFGIGLRPDGTLTDCVVMVFRESRGSEIRDERFRRQFRGKRPTDPLRLNRDVIHITGATYSSRAAADAVRKAMGLWQECCR